MRCSRQSREQTNNTSNTLGSAGGVMIFCKEYVFRGTTEKVKQLHLFCMMFFLK